MYDNCLKYGIRFAKKKTSEDRGGFKREKSTINKMKKCSSMGFEPSMPVLPLDAVIPDSHLITANFLRPE